MRCAAWPSAAARESWVWGEDEEVGRWEAGGRGSAAIVKCRGSGGSGVRG